MESDAKGNGRCSDYALNYRHADLICSEVQTGKKRCCIRYPITSNNYTLMNDDGFIIKFKGFLADQSTDIHMIGYKFICGVTILES